MFTLLSWFSILYFFVVLNYKVTSFVANRRYFGPKMQKERMFGTEYRFCKWMAGFPPIKLRSFTKLFVTLIISLKSIRNVVVSVVHKYCKNSVTLTMIDGALIWRSWGETPYLCFAFVQVILILLFILIEVSRIFSGWKGNLTENVGRVTVYDTCNQ